MPRPPRAAEGGLIYHALNRANARMTIFASDEDYAAFQRVLSEALDRDDMRLLAYCLMPDHFHLLLWPRDDGDLSRFMRWLTLTHTRASSRQRNERFDLSLHALAHPDSHPALACPPPDRRDWPPLSGSVQVIPGATRRPFPDRLPLRGAERLAGQPALGPAGREEEAVRRSIERGQPFGAASWQAEVAARLGLESLFRPRGRPRTKTNNGSRPRCLANNGS
jgi:putative transposase